MNLFLVDLLTRTKLIPLVKEVYYDGRPVFRGNKSIRI